MVLFLLSVCLLTVSAQEFKLTGLFFGCERDVTFEYHKALQDFSTRLYKQVAQQNNDHFALSQYSIWLALSAIAEGTEGDIQNGLFKSLNLPRDSCLREKYYEIATSLESSAEDVKLNRKRVLVLNDDMKINTTWVYTVRASGLIDTQKIPIKNNTEATTKLKDIIKAKTANFNLTGNSIVLDSLDYEGLWTTAFDNSITVNNVDFYDDNEKKIGLVDMLKLRKRVKLAYIPFLNAKLLELPVGNGGRYRMLFIVNLGRNTIRRTIENFPPTFIVDIMPLMTESLIPLEIGIPKFKMTSELDVKKALENIGFADVWKNNASRYISDPPSHLSSLVQRVTVSMDRAGVSPPTAFPLPTLTDIATGIEGLVGRKFVANRPFIYGLVDSQTRTWLFAGAYSQPDRPPVAEIE